MCRAVLRGVPLTAPPIRGSQLYQLKSAQDLCLQIPKETQPCLPPSISLSLTNTSSGLGGWQTSQESGGGGEIPDIGRGPSVGEEFQCQPPHENSGDRGRRTKPLLSSPFDIQENVAQRPQWAGSYKMHLRDVLQAQLLSTNTFGPRRNK